VPEYGLGRVAGAAIVQQPCSASTQAGLAVQLYTGNGTPAQAWAIAGPVS